MRKYWKIIIPSLVLVLTGAIVTPIVLSRGSTSSNVENDMVNNEAIDKEEDVENQEKATPTKDEVGRAQTLNNDLDNDSNKNIKIPKWAKNNTIIKGYYNDVYPDYEIDFLERDKSKSKWLNKEKTNYEVWHNGYKYIVKKTEKPFSIQRIKKILKTYVIGYMHPSDFEANLDNVWLDRNHNIDFAKRDKSKSKWLNKEKTGYQVVVSYKGTSHKYTFQVLEKNSIDKIKKLLEEKI